jgi:hypothetical protein
MIDFLRGFVVWLFSWVLPFLPLILLSLLVFIM